MDMTAHMYGRPEFDTPSIRAGAVAFVKCPQCAAAEGEPCKFDSGKPIPRFAHIGRRQEYVEWRDIFGDVKTNEPEIWLQCREGRHAECKPHPTTCPCKKPPPPCECSCHKKSTSDIDDLLG